MKKSNDQTLKEVINELLESYKLSDKLKEVRLIDSWEKVVGKLINKHTKNLYIKKKVLFVKLDSAALRNELSYARQKIIKALNKEAKEEVIDDIVFK